MSDELGATPRHDAPPKPARRPRYRGTHPRTFTEKYKERTPSLYPETVDKVIASGKTPAGMHLPIMPDEILAALSPKPGELFVDATLGYGGHARKILAALRPGGALLGLDADPVELPKTEARIRDEGFGPDEFRVARTNFAGLSAAIRDRGWEQADGILADLGVSSMQLDDPARGFSVKLDGPLDMRMNPAKGRTAADLLASVSPADLEKMLGDNADEPRAHFLAGALTGRAFARTGELAAAIRRSLAKTPEAEQTLAVRRVFQALRIAVNDEFGALEQLLRQIPACLKPGGRVAVLTFHSGEDRRVKKAFETGLSSGLYAEISDGVIRPSPAERGANPRSTSAKLRWARRPPG